MIDSPFKFLDSYTAADRDIFFGRDQEIEDLYNMVFKTPLLLVYGLSGTGKTSLIQCGLSSRFDGTDWNPFFVRRGDDINTSLAAALQKKLPATTPGDATLTERVSTLFRHYLRPVYLIFDQFEELFILGTPEEQAAFAASLAELIAAELPCKILLVMREEFIAQLYTLERSVPTVYDHRLRVEPMGYPKIREVLVGSFAQFNIQLPHGEAGYEQIYRKVSAGKFGVQLPFLQVYLDMLYREDFARTYPDATKLPAPLPALEFTPEEIESFGEIEQVLSRFLQQQEESIQRRLAAEQSGVPDDAVRRLLDGFVTEEGTKRPIPFEQRGDQLLVRRADHFPGLSAAAVAFTVDQLRQARLLRERDGALELAHDSLALLIDQRRTDEQRRLNRLRRLVRSNYELGQPLTAGHLAELGEEVEKLGLEPAQRDFVAASRQQRDAEREIEIANERRRRQTPYIFAAAIIGVLLAAMAGWQWWEAGQAKTEAEQNLLTAQENEAEAERLATVAQDSAAAAQEQRSLALAQKETADSLQQEAETQAERATLALSEVQRAFAQIVDNILAAAAEDIRLLDYLAALQKLYDARNLRVSAKNAAIAAALLEVAYFWTETGRYARARNVLDTAALTAGRTRVGPIVGSDSLRWLRDRLTNLNADRVAALEKRYYPEMIAVAGGRFEMGCQEGRDLECYDGEKPVHTVQLDDFRIAKTETTVWQYYLFTEATGRELPEVPSWRWNGDHPILRVSWFDAVAYANWVSGQRGAQPVYELEAIPLDPNELYETAITWTDVPDWSATGYRLPTEAEWEYAARGGPQSQGYPYAGSANIDEVAWYNENSGSRTHPVQTKKGNELGLKHMSGNVWEWVWDWYGDYPADEQANPRGPETGSIRVRRGGGWYGHARLCRAANRSSYGPTYRYDVVGFRLARS